MSQARKAFIVGNWKLNKTLSESLALVTEIKNQVSALRHVDVGVAPVATALSDVAKRLEGSSVSVGGQNCHWEQGGAFTGEISPKLLADAGAQFCIVGHSERRLLFGDTDDQVGQRLRACLDADLNVILCCGESLKEREAEETHRVVETQVHAALSGLEGERLGRITVAYEPVWAIGTGKTATPAMAQDVHAMIRALIQNLFGDAAACTRILYGGSVKPKNAAELLAMADIDGALVGGASLSSDDFVSICKAAKP